MEQGSEVAYIYGCIVLCAIPLLTICAAYGVIKMMNKKRRKMKQSREENNNNGKRADKMHVKEWLHQASNPFASVMSDAMPLHSSAPP